MLWALARRRAHAGGIPFASRWVGVVAASMGLAGCRVGGDTSLSKQNDELRRERIELRAQVESLRGEVAEWRAKAEEASRARQAALAPEVLAAIPRIASIAIGGLSGLTPADPGADAKGVAVYLETLDGRRRFTPAVGTLSVEAVGFDRLIDEPSLAERSREGDGSDAARTGGTVFAVRRTLTPGDLREAYRSGVMGTAYEVELPLEKPMRDRSVTLVIRAEFADALTGQVHRAERVVRRAAVSEQGSKSADRK